MLTVEQASKIVKEVTLGAPPTLMTKEAIAFREAVTPQIEAIKQGGHDVDIPAE